MTFAYVVGDVIHAETATLPTAARRVDTGEWVVDLDGAAVDVREACNWFQVVTVNHPPDTTTLIYDRALILVDGVPTEEWTERPKTQDEIDADTRAVNAEVLTSDAATNIATLLATVTALNALTALTNAEINANPAARIKDVVRELKTVARQTVRLARLVTGSTLTADSGS